MLTKKNLLTIFLPFSLLFMSACSPQFNWREVRNNEAPFTILMPAKAESLSKKIQLADTSLDMIMTATEVDGLSFAVGSAKLADASKATDILAAMQNGMIRNIHGEILEPAATANGVMKVQGHVGSGDISMAARFVTRGNWVYQIIIVGPQKKMTPDIIDTFMNSFIAN